MLLECDFSTIVVVQSPSSCLTLCNPKECSTPGLPVPHHLLEFAQVHVHCISDAIQPSHPLTSSFPSALNLSQHQGLFQWVSWPKYWSFSFSISPSSEYSGLISLKISITNEQQTWDDKSSIRTRMPYDKFPWEREWPNRVLLMTLCCETLVYSTGYQMHSSTSSGCKDQTEYSQSS